MTLPPCLVWVPPDHRMLGKERSALTYPLFVLVLGGVMTLLIFTTVLSQPSGGNEMSWGNLHAKGHTL